VYCDSDNGANNFYLISHVDDFDFVELILNVCERNFICICRIENFVTSTVIMPVAHCN
jgi:hypothetical protein